MGERVFVSGAFDDLRSREIRLLDEASRQGEVTLLLWDDQLIHATTGAPPKFPLAERKYVAESIRYVASVRPMDAGQSSDQLPADVSGGGLWVMPAGDATVARRAYAGNHGLRLVEVPAERLKQIPPAPAFPRNPASTRKKVVVTGCFDWLHSGHVRFFEEVSELGDLYVIAGHDANIRLLKGEGHPLFPENERVYMVNAFRFVTCAVVSSGHGWLDGEPEFELIRPDIYAVNEDGDKPEKRKFCLDKEIEYRVLQRLPKQGLPRRTSTILRGF